MVAVSIEYCTAKSCIGETSPNFYGFVLFKLSGQPLESHVDSRPGLANMSPFHSRIVPAIFLLGSKCELRKLRKYQLVGEIRRFLLPKISWFALR